jgi:hypothetical protein
LSVALPFATNLEKVNAITTRCGKSTRDPPYPIRIGRTPVVVQEEEKKNDEVEEVGPQERELQHKIFTTLHSYHFHAEIEKPKWMSSLVSLWT